MVIAYSLVALFIAWIWVDYFRLIDIHHKNNSLLHVIIAFVLGGSSVLLVDLYHAFTPSEQILEINGNLLNDLAYTIFQVGMLEEFAKITAFVVFLSLFRKIIVEPIDYLLFVSTCALGFSCIEHVLYFYNYGPQIIHGRAILATVGHLFDTSITAYGIILFRFQRTKFNFSIVLLCFGLASLAHGIYDFLLMYPPLEHIGWFLMLIYFLITISVFATILNNSINNSPHFSYKNILDSAAIFKRMMLYYLIIFASQVILVLIDQKEEIQMIAILSPFFITGGIVLLTVTRLSRFNLVKGRWQKIKLELPFKINSLFDTSQKRIAIKGENYNEAHINPFMYTYFQLRPINPHTHQIPTGRLAYMENKVVSKKNETFYIVRIYATDMHSPSQLYLLRAKFSLPNMVNNTYPVVAVLKVANQFDPSNYQTIKQFSFQEYAVLVPN